MSLTVHNTGDLVTAGNFKWKVLIYGLPGTGKTLWASGARNSGTAACETGHGSGLLTAAESKLDYVEPTTVQEFEEFVSGRVMADKETLVIDSLSEMCKSFIKEYALSFPRKYGDTLKRKAGVPEQDDYGVMGEVTRRLVRKLTCLDKNIVVTATMKMPQAADPEEGKAAMPGCPDLPGQMALGVTAMFDTVMAMFTRQALRNPKDPKSRYAQRYFVTQPSQQWIAKCRQNANKVPLLAEEEVYDLETGAGSWQALYDKLLAGYSPKPT